MSDPDYCYPPDYTVLRNRLGIRGAAELDAAERDLVTQRLTEPVPHGDFDLDHLTAIHHHLFQDVYDWAGEIRTVSITKGHSEFQHPHFIETGMRDVHRRLLERRYLMELSPNEFAEQAGTIIGDVNYVHPFREGNGRAQFQYLDQLAQRAGHPLDLKRI
jgi:cell filamentation protein